MKGSYIFGWGYDQHMHVQIGHGTPPKIHLDIVFTSPPGPVVRSLEPVSTAGFPFFSSSRLTRAYSQTYEIFVFIASTSLQPCRTARLPSESNSPDSGFLLSVEPTPAKPHSSKESARRPNPRSFVIGGVMRLELSSTHLHLLTDPSRSTLR